jgi:3'-phosphoadenosine 5'-phosphosulfate sulfotransferase (PAPS reductase)/FAD synthetase
LIDGLREEIGKQIARHAGHTFLQFSGGKDSLACLHLCEPFWEELVVVWVNTGDAFPETIAQMKGVREMVPHFLEVCSDQPVFIHANGWPVDIVPVASSAFGKLIDWRSIPTLVAFPVCCGANIWQPMQDAIGGYGATLLIRGTKDCDQRRGPDKPGEIIEGVERCFPLWDLTDEGVWKLLAQLGPAPLQHYAWTETSLDCMHCTAYLDENAGKMRYLEKFHPEVSVAVQDRLKLISRAVRKEMDNLMSARIYR